MMLRKGEIVSLAIFVSVGLLMGSLLVSGGPLETDEPITGEFDDGNGAKGGFSANVLMGVYTPAGEPVEIQKLGMQMLGIIMPDCDLRCPPNQAPDQNCEYCVPLDQYTVTTTPPITTPYQPPETTPAPPPVTTPPPSNGNGGTVPPKSVMNHWKATVSDVTITGENIDPATISFEVTWRWNSPVGDIVLDADGLPASQFNVVGDASSFTATTTWSGTFEKRLIDIANEHGGGKVNVNVERFDWDLFVVIKAKAKSVTGDIINADPVVTHQRFYTNYIGSTSGGDAVLIVDANFNDYIQQASIFPGDSAGLSVVFIIVVMFVGLWYKWGRKLLQWG